MPDFDDVSQPPHFRPQLEYSISIVERYTVLLKDGETTATIYPIHSAEELPPGLLAFLCDEFNMEVDRGDTFPFFDTLHIETFQNYWFGSFAAVMVLGDVPTLDRSKQWEKECLGTFYIKPNYPGRCSHICTAGFLVNAGIRGKGIGRTLAECYLEWAPRLGYTYSIFNLVFETNMLARMIWDSLGFKVIGKIKAAGILKGHEQAIDAFIYGRELMLHIDTNGGSYRFERIKFYLETGNYPKNLDRLEKSRLRSSASHYRLVNGKLMLKGREVIADQARQTEISTAFHHISHAGVNKTTAAILEKYHWSRIKDTVANVIKDCDFCRSQRGLVLKRPSSSSQQHHHLVSSTIEISSRNDQLSNGFSKHHQLKPSPSSSSSNQSIKDSNQHIHQLPHFSHLQAQDNSQSHNNHNSHSSHVDQNLLSSEFDADDPSGIIAAVEAAQRSHSLLLQLLQKTVSLKKSPSPHNQHDQHHQQQQNLYNYDNSTSQHHHNNNNNNNNNINHHHHQQREEDADQFHYSGNDEIDPDVISRALIQANEENGSEDSHESDE